MRRGCKFEDARFKLKPDNPIEEAIALATSLAHHPSGLTRRSLVWPTGQPQDQTTVNRLYGTAIGVHPERWPKREGKPMQHLMTLETTIFPDDGIENLGSDTKAIAIFLTSLMDDIPGDANTDHAAILRLTERDLALGAEPSQEGELLAVATLEVPNALFKGGKKTGALFDLRHLFDRDDLVCPYRSPRWIQESKKG